MAPSWNKGCATVQKQLGWLTPMKESDVSVHDNQVNVNQPILNKNVRVKANPRSPSESNGNSTNPQRPSAYNGNSAYDTPAPDTDDTEIAGLKADLQRINEQPKRKGHGPAKGTKFDKLRKLVKIPLRVKENARGDSKLTLMKLKLLQGDFVLDWDRFEDQQCVKTQLQVSFRQYRYKLHRIYKKFNNAEIARANPPDDVSAGARDKLCDIWQSEEYQKLCKKNVGNRNKLKINHTSGSKSLDRLRLEKVQKEEDGTTIEFYKRSRIQKDCTWVCQEALQIYQKIIELQKERDPDQKDEAIAEEIFTEVLGRKSGYVRGMVDKYKSELEYYKNAYEGLTNEVKVLNERCNDYAGRYASYDEKL
ncbi:hypothetical protein CJ030_MR6G001705 [Morella rubra]|uniref:Uncharacterized protein n=1 Tax=Morella rubra TaxID=262757 RepID=A0A6A1V9U7_9ROSI|nr:hypothetical protein CJ030_MR6G001705 [Morella rubra]